MPPRRRTPPCPRPRPRDLAVPCPCRARAAVAVPTRPDWATAASPSISLLPTPHAAPHLQISPWRRRAVPHRPWSRRRPRFRAAVDALSLNSMEAPRPQFTPPYLRLMMQCLHVVEVAHCSPRPTLWNRLLHLHLYSINTLALAAILQDEQTRSPGRLLPNGGCGLQNCRERGHTYSSVLG